jgi:predicted nucleic acid-binding protein
MIFVDTDIIIDIYRGYLPSIEWKNTIQDEIILSGYTGFELISGCINSKDLNKIKKTLNSYNLIWASNEACKEAFNTFSKLKLRIGIDFVDCLIGHTAVELNLPLYTFNKKHYQHIPKLKIIQPYKK